MGDESVRWTVVVDKRTDRKVRMHLAERSAKKGDLSKFIVDAVNRELFMQTVADVRKGFEDMTSQEIESLVDEAVAWARNGDK